MEQLDNLIYDTISTLRSNKKQPNENAIYFLISSKLESLSKDQLEERLSYLANEEKLKNKPHNGKSSYYLETNRFLISSRSQDQRQSRWIIMPYQF